MKQKIRGKRMNSDTVTATNEIDPRKKVYLSYPRLDAAPIQWPSQIEKEIGILRFVTYDTIDLEELKLETNSKLKPLFLYGLIPEKTEEEIQQEAAANMVTENITRYVSAKAILVCDFFVCDLRRPSFEVTWEITIARILDKKIIGYSDRYINSPFMPGLVDEIVTSYNALRNRILELGHYSLLETDSNANTRQPNKSGPGT